MNLSRFTEDSHEEIQLKGLYGTLVQALSYDDKQMILIGFDSKKGEKIRLICNLVTFYLKVQDHVQ